jgi:hypothetical protein
MQKLIMGVVAAGILLLGVSAAVCAERPEAQDKIEERLEIITAWKMMERLNLDPPTAEKIPETEIFPQRPNRQSG